jgi:hypothetical protein
MYQMTKQMDQVEVSTIWTNKRTRGGVDAEDAMANQMEVDTLRRQVSAGIVSTVWPAVTSDLRLSLERQAADNKT